MASIEQTSVPEPGTGQDNRTEGGAKTRQRALDALRFRNFRLFWLALICQVAGQMMFQFTLGWLAYEITGSPAYLAFVHLCGFAPQIALTLLGGVLADRWDPRRLIGVAQSVGAATMLILGALALAGLAEPWHLACASFFLGVSTSIDEPSRGAFFPRLFPDRSQLHSAVPLISTAWGGMRIVAPSIGGFVIAAFGAHASFLLSALGVGVMIAAVCVVRPATAHAPLHGDMLRNLLEGVRYARADEVFSTLIAVALLNAAFAMGYIHMLPVFAKDVWGVDARGLGILSAATGAGALTGYLTCTWTLSRATPRNILVTALSAFSTLLLGLAWSDGFWVALGLLALAGYAQANIMTSVQVTLQTLVEEKYRGRVMALYSLAWSLMVLSGFLLNFAASFLGPRLALTCGACIVLAYVWRVPARSAALRRVTLAPKAI